MLLPRQMQACGDPRYLECMQVLLEDLPDKVRRVIEDHNKRALELYVACSRASAARLATSTHALPASGVSLPAGRSPALSEELPQTSALMDSLEKARIVHVLRVSFVANSGHGDDFGSPAELEREARPEARVNLAAIPVIPTRGIRGRKLLLNRYALDFLTHGQFKVQTHLQLTAFPAGSGVG